MTPPTYHHAVPRRALRPSADRILSTAETLFASKGYGEVSLRQLNAAAGISTTAFYARFESKAAVLDKLTENLFAELRSEAALELRNVNSFEDGIDRGVDLLCARFGPRKQLVRLVIAESGAFGGQPRAPGSPSSSRRRISYTMLTGFMAHYLRALTARGRLDVADPDALAWALVGALEMQIVRWAVWDELDDEELAVQLRAVARAILPKERL